uniref:Alcohol dehydrogenase n=1 Tax=Rhizophora mucronata TaxID=61149 RepID=A0A2P2LRZ7_RHIMU
MEKNIPLMTIWMGTKPPIKATNPAFTTDPISVLTNCTQYSQLPDRPIQILTNTSQHACTIIAEIKVSNTGSAGIEYGKKMHVSTTLFANSRQTCLESRKISMTPRTVILKE